MNNKDKHYILLLEQIIGRIKVNLSEEYLEKLNLNIDTSQKKKRLTIRELESLEIIIKDLTKIPNDEKFQSKVLTALKAFLTYGSVKRINNESIVLVINNASKANGTTELTINISKSDINYIIKNKEYEEEATWKTLNTDYYTTYSTKETTIYPNQESDFYDITETKEFHGFHDNKEIISRIITKHDNYVKNKRNKSISRIGLGPNNYKEVTYYFRDNGFLIRKYKKNYRNEKLAKQLNAKEYQISEDYNKENKYIDSNGNYKDFDQNLYKSFIRGKCKINSIYNRVHRSSKH